MTSILLESLMLQRNIKHVFESGFPALVYGKRRQKEVLHFTVIIDIGDFTVEW